MTVYRIPLQSVQQTFDIDLGEQTYTLRVYFNKQMPAWCIDVGDNANRALINGHPLLPGANSLEQYRYKGFGGVLILYTNGDPDYNPGLNDLGGLTSLLYVPYKTDA